MNDDFINIDFIKDVDKYDSVDVHEKKEKDGDHTFTCVYISFYLGDRMTAQVRMPWRNFHFLHWKLNEINKHK